MTEDVDSSESEEKIVFTSKDPTFLEDEGYDVLETYDLKGAGYAAKIAIAEVAILDVDRRITDIENADEEFELLIDDSHISPLDKDLSTIEDYRELNNCPVSGNTGKDIHVAVTDSGLDTTHSLFSELEVERYDFTGTGEGDNVGHGTGVMGQIIRFAPDIKATVLKIFGEEGRTSLDVILSAYEWLLDNTDEVDLVNMSWGSQRKVTQIDRIHNTMVSNGIRDVTAAGNSGGDPGSPATASRSFSIGATDEDGNVTEFSSWGYKVPDVVSIGKDCRLAQAEETTMGDDLPGPWVKASGTSFSSPAVCGMAAKFAETEFTDVKSIFGDTATDVKDGERDGHGLVNYSKALEESPGSPEPPGGPLDTASARFISLGGSSYGTISAKWLPRGKSEAKLIENNQDGTLIRFSES